MKKEVWKENLSSLEINPSRPVQESQSVNQAAREHGIPRTTLKDHASGGVAHGSNPGPKLYLSAVKENELRDFVLSFRYGKMRKDTRGPVTPVRSIRVIKNDRPCSEEWYLVDLNGCQKLTHLPLSHLFC